MSAGNVQSLELLVKQYFINDQIFKNSLYYKKYIFFLNKIENYFILKIINLIKKYTIHEKYIKINISF